MDGLQQGVKSSIKFSNYSREHTKSNFSVFKLNGYRIKHDEIPHCFIDYLSSVNYTELNSRISTVHIHHYVCSDNWVNLIPVTQIM